MEDEDVAELKRADKELRQKLTGIFVRNNQGKYEEIKDAIKAGDKKQAHRLVHTLKGNAGQLGKTSLQKAAMEVEAGLNEKIDLFASRRMERLEKELKAVMAELAQHVPAPLEAEAEAAPMEKAFAQELLERLQPLLEGGDIECLTYVGDLKRIPGSEELVRQIENLDFKPATKTFLLLKECLRNDG
jgi:HPt (histidine-containing phosphotransfer) domain-containing protein